MMWATHHLQVLALGTPCCFWFSTSLFDSFSQGKTAWHATDAAKLDNRPVVHHWIWSSNSVLAISSSCSFLDQKYVSLYFSAWWFGAFFVFTYVGNNHPNWLFVQKNKVNHQPVLAFSHCGEWFPQPAEESVISSKIAKDVEKPYETSSRFQHLRIMFYRVFTWILHGILRVSTTGPQILQVSRDWGGSWSQGGARYWKALFEHMFLWRKDKPS